MAKRRTIRRYHKPQPTVPVAVLAGFAPLAKDVVQGYQSGGFSGAAHYLVGGVTGIDTNTGKWNWPWALTHFWIPVAAGIAVHKVANKMGVNRVLSRAGVPFLRV